MKVSNTTPGLHEIAREIGRAQGYHNPCEEELAALLDIARDEVAAGKHLKLGARQLGEREAPVPPTLSVAELIERNYQTALAAWEQGLAAYEKANPGKSVLSFVNNDEGKRLHVAYNKAFAERLRPHAVRGAI